MAGSPTVSTGGFPAVYDVTEQSHGRDLDLRRLEVVRTAPAFLTTAERLLLFSLVYALRPRRFLELGVLHGGASLIVASALDALGSDGRLVLVDLNPQLATDDWERIQGRSVLITGRSPEVLTEAQVLEQGPYDMAFLDAGHKSEHVRRDALAVLPLMVPGGHLLFHDAYRDEVAQGIEDVLLLRAPELVDLGVLTREVTVRPDRNVPGKRVMSCGFRMLQVRAASGTRGSGSGIGALGRRLRPMIQGGMGTLKRSMRRHGRE